MKVIQPRVNGEFAQSLPFGDARVGAKVVTLHQHIGLDGSEILLGLRDSGVEHPLAGRAGKIEPGQICPAQEQQLIIIIDSVELCRASLNQKQN